MTNPAHAGSRPILVTGAHRSGTTWVGRMIARSPAVRYIHEPFNPDAFEPGICAARFEREFTYVCAENAASYQNDLRRCLELRYRFGHAIPAIRTLSHAVRSLRDSGRFAISRWRRARPLMKDPHAVFSAEWLEETFGMDVVVMVRHPAAFVGSIKKAQWSFRFEQFLEQPLLMRRHLRAFEAEIEALAAGRADLVDQGILLWNVIYDVVRKYADRHPGWVFVRHEDLSRNPDSVFRDLYQKLGLGYTRNVRRAINDFSGPHNPAEQHPGSHIRRDSRANIWNWIHRLTADEIARIKARTQPVAGRFYTEEDWHH
jgi:hypothetical protein